MLKLRFMTKLKVGNKITHDFLGQGEVVKIIQGTSKKVFAYMVMYEKNPPLDYNGGCNPCLCWASDLTIQV